MLAEDACRVRGGAPLLKSGRCDGVRNVQERRRAGGAQGRVRGRESERRDAMADPLLSPATVHAETHYVIDGGVRLSGDVRLSGAKNAVTKHLVAAMLTEDVCTIHNAPRALGDVIITEQVMRALGSDVAWPAAHTI